MKKTTTSLLTVALAGAVSLAATTDTRAASVQVLMNDDFSSNTATTGTAFRQNNLGDGLWHSAGAWSVGGGVLQATGDTDNAASEGAIIQAAVVGGATGQTINLSFDYTLAAAGESLTVFLYGTKTEVGFNTSGTGRMANHGHTNGRVQYLELEQDDTLVSSVEFVGGQTLSESPPASYIGPGGSYSEFALISGATSGTFSQSVDLSQWGLSVEDFDYINVGFARNSAAGSGVTIDNLLLTVPEPSSAALLGLGGLALVLRRKRS